MTPARIAELFSKPLKVNKLTLANRVVMGPMAANAPTKAGGPSEQTIAFYEARAKGGVGMIIAGGIVATNRSRIEAPNKTSLRFDIDDFIPDLKRVADAVHRYNVPIIAEIMPGFGRMGVPGPGRPTISASPLECVIPEERFPAGIMVPGGRITPVPDEATIVEIERYEAEMVASAVRAHKAGWDGVEVAAHMSYFAASFLAPRTNWRTDQYGGSVENRARMLTNIVDGIREQLGRDFVIGLRIVADDYIEGSQGATGYAEVAKAVEAAGIDYLALTPAVYETMDINASTKDGALVNDGVARTHRDVISVPIIVQGQHKPANAAEVLQQDLGDLVSFARQLLADPELANKLTSGRADEVVRCRRQNDCLRRMIFGFEVRCPVNPSMGRESRKAGALPPTRRMVQVPVEKAVMGLTGSKALMGLASKLAKKK
ncbi:MAG: NADH:flavin oxidoreductase [Novosphingobium sp.]|jgi:2,4-dienoyl-CoA reductase (NADPH2)|nr:NADH:flavin oxidoreductase [Novosphingobium sp.]